MKYNLIPAQAEQHVVHLYCNDFNGDWFVSYGFGLLIRPEIKSWLSTNTPNWTYSSWVGSGNGVCSPEDDHFRFVFCSREHADSFVDWIKGPWLTSLSNAA